MGGRAEHPFAPGYALSVLGFVIGVAGRNTGAVRVAIGGRARPLTYIGTSLDRELMRGAMRLARPIFAKALVTRSVRGDLSPQV